MEQSTQFNMIVDKIECSYDSHSKVLANWTCELKKIEKIPKVINMRIQYQPGLSVNYILVTKIIIFSEYYLFKIITSIFSAENIVGIQETKMHKIRDIDGSSKRHS